MTSSNDYFIDTRKKKKRIHLTAACLIFIFQKKFYVQNEITRNTSRSSVADSGTSVCMWHLPPNEGEAKKKNKLNNLQFSFECVRFRHMSGTWNESITGIKHLLRLAISFPFASDFV